MKKQDTQDRLRRQDMQDKLTNYRAYPAGEADPAYPVSFIPCKGLNRELFRGAREYRSQILHARLHGHEF